VLTFIKIKKRVEGIIKVVIDPESLEQYVDEAQKEIAVFFGVPDEFEVEVDKVGKEYSLPDDYIELIKVVEGEEEPYNRIRDFRITPSRQIKFTSVGKFKVQYLRAPKTIDSGDINAVPEIHSVFHPNIVGYCVGRYWEDHSEGVQEELGVGQLYMQKFYGNIKAKAITLRKGYCDTDDVPIKGWW